MRSLSWEFFKINGFRMWLGCTFQLRRTTFTERCSECLELAWSTPNSCINFFEPESSGIHRFVFLVCFFVGSQSHSHNLWPTIGRSGQCNSFNEQTLELWTLELHANSKKKKRNVRRKNQRNKRTRFEYFFAAPWPMKSSSQQKKFERRIPCASTEKLKQICTLLAKTKQLRRKK